MRQPRKDIITLTDAAVERVKYLLSARSKPAAGIRIGVKSGGCSGLSYKFEYADARLQGEEEINQKGVTLFIEPTAVMYLVGTTLDYVDEEVRAGFTFINPNEKGRCGCGESFSV
jgi:iron-sulfur cluster assembly protein